MMKYELRHTEDFTEFLKDNNYTCIDLYLIQYDGWVQFRNCQAWYRTVTIYSERGSREALLIQSYYTLVAVYFKDTEEFIRLRRYSRTTSKQCTQIEAMFRLGGVR